MQMLTGLTLHDMPDLKLVHLKSTWVNPSKNELIQSSECLFALTKQHQGLENTTTCPDPDWASPSPHGTTNLCAQNYLPEASQAPSD